jgi:hypothetical protein
MAKLKSFEQFVAEMDRTEEIEQDVVDTAEVDSKEIEEVEDEAEEVQEEEAEEVESEETPEEEAAEEAEEEKEKDEDSDDEDESEEKEEESEEEVSEAEEVEEEEHEGASEAPVEVKTVAEMLKEVYESSCKNEAKAYEEDAHDEHTVESYMKENAALIAALAANTLKEMKEEYAVEAFEAACNEMIEAYTKKMNEMKEMDSAPEAEDTAE